MRLIHYVTNGILSHVKPRLHADETLLLPLYYDDCLGHSSLKTMNWALLLSSDSAYNSDILRTYEPSTVVLGAYLFNRPMAMKEVVDMAGILNDRYKTIVDISYLNANERQYIYNSPIENWRHLGVSMDDPFSQRAQLLYWPRFVPIQRVAKAPI
jgi:hypothetical protein